jgi:hypothetical protein
MEFFVSPYRSRIVFLSRMVRATDRVGMNTRHTTKRRNAMKTILMVTLILSFAATSAMAATRNQSRAMLSAAAAQAYASANNTGNTVVKEGKVRGTDPDPYVRFELNREVDPANVSGQ